MRVAAAAPRRVDARSCVRSPDIPGRRRPPGDRAHPAGLTRSHTPGPARMRSTNSCGGAYGSSAERATTRQHRNRSPPTGIGDGNGHGDSSIHRLADVRDEEPRTPPQRTALELDRLAVLLADVHGRGRPPAEHAVEGAHARYSPSDRPEPAARCEECFPHSAHRTPRSTTVRSGSSRTRRAAGVKLPPAPGDPRSRSVIEPDRGVMAGCSVCRPDRPPERRRAARGVTSAPARPRPSSSSAAATSPTGWRGPAGLRGRDGLPAQHRPAAAGALARPRPPAGLARRGLARPRGPAARHRLRLHRRSGPVVVRGGPARPARHGGRGARLAATTTSSSPSCTSGRTPRAAGSAKACCGRCSTGVTEAQVLLSTPEYGAAVAGPRLAALPPHWLRGRAARPPASPATPARSPCWAATLPLRRRPPPGRTAVAPRPR